MANNSNSGKPVDEIRELREKVEELTRNQKRLTRNQEIMDRRQRRLRAFVWGTNKGMYSDANGQGGSNVQPLDDARFSDDNLKQDFELTPDQPSVMKRVTRRLNNVTRRLNNTTQATKGYQDYQDSLMRRYAVMSLENKQRSEKNEKELDKSLEKRANRLFGKKKSRLHEELQF